MVTKSKSILPVIASLVMVACGPSPELGDVMESNDQAITGIIGGKEVAPNESPAQTTVVLYDTAAKNVACTGSLIGNNLVLTAAHCLQRDPTKILVIFSTNLQTANMEMARSVVGAMIHNSWLSKRALAKDTGDIALVKYQGTTPAGYKAATILPSAAALRDYSTIIIAGYGMTDATKRTGSGALRQAATTIANNKFSSSEIMVEQRTGRGACHGDSGGPAFLYSNGVYYLWGITSRGYADAKNECRSFSLYTNILYYMKWLQETARALMLKNQFNFTFS